MYFKNKKRKCYYCGLRKTAAYSDYEYNPYEWKMKHLCAECLTSERKETILS